MSDSELFIPLSIAILAGSITTILAVYITDMVKQKRAGMSWKTILDSYFKRI